MILKKFELNNAYVIDFALYSVPCQTLDKGLMPETPFSANFLGKVSTEKLSKSSFRY